MIQVKNLTKKFGEITAVDSISFSIKKGEIVGLLGPNGAGKTTTMRMLTGYYSPTSGEVIIDGKAVVENENSPKKLIGYLPESSALYYDMLVCDYLQFIGESHQMDPNQLSKGIERVVEATSIEKYFYRPIGQLSKGYKQRVGIAATLLHNPEILILDEPTSGLDPNQIIEIQGLIKNLAHEKTIILSSHILSEIENTCERVIIISNGNIVLDKPLEELPRYTQEGFTIHLTLKGMVEQASEKIREKFGTQVSNLQQQTDSNGNTTISLQSGSHFGEQLYKLSVLQDWTIYELYARKENLENIFTRLTSASTGGGE